MANVTENVTENVTANETFNVTIVCDDGVSRVVCDEPTLMPPGAVPPVEVTIGNESVPLLNGT